MLNLCSSFSCRTAHQLFHHTVLILQLDRNQLVVVHLAARCCVGDVPLGNPCVQCPVTKHFGSAVVFSWAPVYPLRGAPSVEPHRQMLGASIHFCPAFPTHHSGTVRSRFPPRLMLSICGNPEPAFFAHLRYVSNFLLEGCGDLFSCASTSGVFVCLVDVLVLVLQNRALYLVEPVFCFKHTL